MKELNRSITNLPLKMPVRVLQFGEGNFLRGFADWMIDIMNEKVQFNGAVQIVRAVARGQVHLLNQQGGLYHVYLQGIKDGNPYQDKRLISSIAGSLNPYEDYDSYLKLGENENLRFVISNTTEAGIEFDEKDTSSEVLPKSFPGKLTSLLFHRYRFFKGAPEKGLIILPCELIENNGSTLRKLVLDYAILWKLPVDFQQWITSHNIFCNTLVDRIVPGFPKDNIEEIQRSIGYDDKMLVVAEPYHFWAIEAPVSIASEFPAEKAGLNVAFVESLESYRVRKVRILNGAHSLMVPLAFYQGLVTVKETINDPFLGDFVKKAIYEEIIPTLDIPENELIEFAGDVIERFQNPFIRHEILSIALNSISKFKVRVLPSILEYHNRTMLLPAKLLHSLAALIVFYRGKWKGQAIPLQDNEENLIFFKEAWESKNISEVVYKVLSNTRLWGQNLVEVEGLLAFVTNQAQKILDSEKAPERGL